jgi:hypothetical protein
MSVTPNVRNCCDLALTKCLKILPCSHFCLQQRLCAGVCTTVSYEDVDGGFSGAAVSALDGVKISFTGSNHCCGTIKQNDAVTVGSDAWYVLKIEAGKITLQKGTKAVPAAGQLVLNGINGHLCSVFYDATALGCSAPFCADNRFDIARTTSSGSCSATTCNSCTC